MRRSGQDHEALYTIAVAARLTRMHPQTLRKYERAGLIRPSRSAGSHRFYSPADVARLQRIQYLVEERGLNIAGVEMALGMTDQLDALARTSTAEELWSAIDVATRPSRMP
ncbi:MAG TPA: MerR family transcriptional regulator [Candidatus Limnocylindrales bacterium]|nr:MerR family transcriptional regulator [Candidatus Limnocylindrales bacterium]